MTNKHANTRRNIASQGTSRTFASPSPVVRRRLLRLAPALLVLLGACGGASIDDGAPAQTTGPASPGTTLDATATTVDNTQPVETTAPTQTTQSPSATTTVAPSGDAPITVAPSTVASTTVAPNTVAPSTVAPTTMNRTVGTPRLSVSPSSGLDGAGTRVTVRGTGYDIAKGVYVIVCNQAAWTDVRRCVGGVNIDGSSPVSEWVSSNPPAYAKGLTVPFANDGSFSITLVVRAIGDAIDCTKEQCGVVTFADHTRRDDRSQDVFVPITFKSGS